ncbi:M56 family metallopeptidase [Paenibacillus filicis]|uniref:M56 family metallopeptidase n=1 Tax=Paenibacillus filicis TaxID=669464 RepID=A0ABU9DDZ5_9BACL
MRDEGFVALAIGMRKPIIVISTQVLETFSSDEVKAILLHEWHHCRNLDNVKMFLMTLLTEAFGYWPIMKPVFRYYQIWTELLADRFAIHQMGTELHLASCPSGGSRSIRLPFILRHLRCIIKSCRCLSRISRYRSRYRCLDHYWHPFRCCCY